MSNKPPTIEIFKFLILLSCIGYISACNFTVRITQVLEQEGFHRNMTYDVAITAITEKLPKTWPYNDCIVGLHQTLPAGLYANPDELNELRRVEKLNALAKKTNIELPAELSEPTTVIIMEKITSALLIMWIPLHARYHKPARGGGYVYNNIDPPQLYMRCPDNRLEPPCMTKVVPADFLCSRKSKDKEKGCGWKKVSFAMNNDMPLQWPTPVGDLNEYLAVTVITTIAILVGSIYLVYTIQGYKFRRY